MLLVYTIIYLLSRKKDIKRQKKCIKEETLADGSHTRVSNKQPVFIVFRRFKNAK
jgi:hypothetical protein